MIRLLMLALVASGVAACSQDREVDTNPFALNSTLRVEEYYRRRIAEQPGEQAAYIYDQEAERWY